MIRSVITGTGSALPAKCVTNADLAARVDTSDEWIVERTGIRQRYIAQEDETTSSLATDAARSALEAAGVDASEIGGTHPLAAFRAHLDPPLLIGPELGVVLHGHDTNLAALLGASDAPALGLGPLPVQLEVPAGNAALAARTSAAHLPQQTSRPDHRPRLRQSLQYAQRHAHSAHRHTARWIGQPGRSSVATPPPCR